MLRTHTSSRTPHRLLAEAAAILIVVPPLLALPVSAAAASVDEWLQRMASSTERYNYRGTVARRFDGRVEYMRVVHRYANGEVSERIETLDGADRTLVRDANGVRCILPDSKAVLVQDTTVAHGFVGRVPVSLDRMRSRYDVVMTGAGERIAGRKTVQLSIKPRDVDRYGHRVWLEAATGLPLKAELINELGRVVEETRFVDFALEETIADEEFELDINVAGFRQIGRGTATPMRKVVASAAESTAWSSPALPQGFELTHESRSDDGMMHLRFDDGMAALSVFIEPVDTDNRMTFGASRLGGTHTYSVLAYGRQITAVGETPLSTVRGIAEAIAKSDLPDSQ